MADPLGVGGNDQSEHGGNFYRDLIDQMGDGVYFVDTQRQITYWSGGAERLTGYSSGAVVGRSCREGLLNHVDDEGRELCGDGCPLLATMRDGQPREAHVFMRHADGHHHPVWVRATPLRDAAGRIIGAVEAFGDDSAGRAARAELGELQRLALLDPLTGLGNRRYLERQLELWWHDWNRHSHTFGILFADIDRFKHVNDTHGHTTGDDILVIVAQTIEAALRANDVVARYGGEEFVILAHADLNGLATMAERIRTLVANSHTTAGHQQVPVTISLGGALAGADDTPTALLRRADTALYTAKQRGRNRVHVLQSTLCGCQEEAR